MTHIRSWTATKNKFVVLW